MEFVDDRGGDIEYAKEDIRKQIDAYLEKDPATIRLSQLLADLRLAPILRRLMGQYDRASLADYRPDTMAKLIIYRKARLMSRAELYRHLYNHADVAADLDIDRIDVPDETTLKNFVHQRVTPDNLKLIEFTAGYIRNKCRDIVEEDLEVAETVDGLAIEPAPVERKTYTQDWSSYNKAQTNEKVLFKQLAADLLNCVEEKKEEKSRGPKGYDIQTKLFAMLMKEYTGKSGRRNTSELKECQQQGYIRDVPHFNSTLNFYHEAGMASVLKELIAISAKPLKDFEETFNADSTGLSTDLYKSWKEFRFGNDKKQKRKDFLKLHVMSGAKTNIITSVEVTKGTAGDSPQFTKLLEETAKHFDVHEVTADKAYGSRENVQAVSDEGGMAFVPPRSNVTGKAKGSQAWKQTYEYFHQHHEQFMRHYHKRSNVETLFWMMKQKIGTKINNKKRIAQFNEALVKCLVHNIIVLIHEMYELDVEIDFNYCAAEVFAQK